MKGSSTLVINGSSRKQSYTNVFVEDIMQGIQYELVQLCDLTINHYDYNSNYDPSDQFMLIADKMMSSNKIIFATPVYWYAMSGLMKVFFDRFTDLVTIHKTLGRRLSGKNMFLIAVGSDPELPDGFSIPFTSTASYFNMHLRASIYRSIKFPNTKEPEAVITFRKALNHTDQF